MRGNSLSQIHLSAQNYLDMKNGSREENYDLTQLCTEKSECRVLQSSTGVTMVTISFYLTLTRYCSLICISFQWTMNEEKADCMDTYSRSLVRDSKKMQNWCKEV